MNKKDKGMEADGTGPLKEDKIESIDTNSPDFTTVPEELSAFYQEPRPVTGKEPPLLKGRGKSRKEIR